MNPAVKKNVIFYFLTDISGFISVYTTFFTMTWLTFQLTGSPSSLGLVGFAQNLPFLLFSVYGGVLADKYYILSIKKQRPLLEEMYKERGIDEGHEPYSHV